MTDKGKVGETLKQIEAMVGPMPQQPEGMTDEQLALMCELQAQAMVDKGFPFMGRVILELLKRWQEASQ